MSRPTLHPTWDTNVTHCTAPTGGHVTDGYASNEVPTSDEMNEWMRRVGAEFLWINAQIDDVTTLPQTITRSPYSTGLITAHAVLTAGTNLKVPVVGLRKGDTIVAIRARGIDAGTPQVIHTVAATGLAIVVADLTDYVLVMTESGGAQFGLELFSVTDGVASGALASSATVAAPTSTTLYACSVDVQRPA